jgi:two-component system chemotaxis response regulator CheY
MYPHKNHLDSKVLIVDDMASTRGLIKDMLRELGFTNVSMARNGREALQKVQEENADLVISDQLMDDMTGTELLEALRKDPKLADIPFIMVSAVRDAPAIDSALDLGVDDYIAKPISMGLLQRKISDVFRRRSATV